MFQIRLCAKGQRATTQVLTLRSLSSRNISHRLHYRCHVGCVWAVEDGRGWPDSGTWRLAIGAEDSTQHYYERCRRGYGNYQRLSYGKHNRTALSVVEISFESRSDRPSPADQGESNANGKICQGAVCNVCVGARGALWGQVENTEEGRWKVS
jgi:hypothetical protein